MKRTTAAFFKADGSKIISSPTRFSSDDKFPDSKSLEETIPKTSIVLTIKKKEEETPCGLLGAKK